MYWKRTVLEYDILVPPISKPFSEFSPTESKAFFEWYLAHIPQRIDYLAQKSECDLDMAFDSMVPLWRWFLKNATIESTPKKKLTELKSKLKNVPLMNDVIEAEKTQFSLQTEYMIRDIGMYVGQVFVESSEKLQWDYHTDADKDSFANIPLVSGFYDINMTPPFPMQFEPVHMVGVLASNLFDGTQKETDLLDLCHKWIKNIV